MRRILHAWLFAFITLAGSLPSPAASQPPELILRTDLFKSAHFRQVDASGPRLATPFENPLPFVFNAVAELSPGLPTNFFPVAVTLIAPIAPESPDPVGWLLTTNPIAPQTFRVSENFTNEFDFDQKLPGGRYTLVVQNGFPDTSTPETVLFALDLNRLELPTAPSIRNFEALQSFDSGADLRVSFAPRVHPHVNDKIIFLLLSGANTPTPTVVYSEEMRGDADSVTIPGSLLECQEDLTGFIFFYSFGIYQQAEASGYQVNFRTVGNDLIEFPIHPAPVPHLVISFAPDDEITVCFNTIKKRSYSLEQSSDTVQWTTLMTTNAESSRVAWNVPRSNSDKHAAFFRAVTSF